MTPNKVDYFSDVLCVWAYVGQSRLNRLATDFGDQIDIRVQFCSVFPNSWQKIDTQWKTRDGFEGYAAHVQQVAGKFKGITIHSDAWRVTRPRSSASPHLFIKAVELVEQDLSAGGGPVPFLSRLSVRAAQELRSAFFERGQDVSAWAAHREIAGSIGVDFDQAVAKIESGEAIAELASDYDRAQSLKIEGSPTYVLNDGRQKLFGNVSYGVIEANMNELLTGAGGDVASLCS